MRNFDKNRYMKYLQFKTMSIVVLALMFISAVLIWLLEPEASNAPKSAAPDFDIAGITDAEFNKANTDSALMTQQNELEQLKHQLSDLKKSLTKGAEDKAENEELKSQLLALQAQMQALQEEKVKEPAPETKQDEGLWHPVNQNMASPYPMQSPQIHMVSFRQRPVRKAYSRLNPANYVPANTSVRAVVLGGADADASVTGQSNNNGVMLFKFLEDGTLPNGVRSRLSGCRVSSTTYGDISSERAYGALYKLSCAKPGQPIIEKTVTGWVFFNGKVGIKGKMVMRDGKIMTWAGVSGALAGVSGAAQNVLPVQQFSPLGVTSVVPSNRIGSAMALGATSKSADILSQYYIKRAEQYHPVVSVGSGNVVTIVFKDGFYLEPDEKDQDEPAYHHQSQEEATPSPKMVSNDAMDFSVPKELLEKIEHNGGQAPTQFAQGANP